MVQFMYIYTKQFFGSVFGHRKPAVVTQGRFGPGETKGCPGGKSTHDTSALREAKPINA